METIHGNCDTIHLTCETEEKVAMTAGRPCASMQLLSEIMWPRGNSWKSAQRKTRWIKKDAERFIMTAYTIGPPLKDARNRKARGTGQER